MSIKSLLPYLLLATLVSACSFRVATPPARTAFFGSPRILPEGESAMTAEGTGAGELFGPSIGGGSLTYERGLGSLREIIVTPTAGVIQGQSEYLGLSLDIKQGITETRNVAFTYGTGYFWNEYAQAISGQAGILVGFENRYFVPTLSMMLFLSDPFQTSLVCGYSDSGFDSWEDDSEQVCAEPTRTIGVRMGLTTEIKLPWRVSIIPSIALIPLSSKTHSLQVMQLSGALRFEY